MNNLKIGDKLHGFTVTEIDDLSEYRGLGIRLIHDKTAADVYHIKNDDKENLFSFIFKTPPEDNTGVAHIIEHCVLAGSEKYPIKDPFLSMMNGSMNTFLNAMTYPDKTVYPAATTVRKDYFNLMSVYADAVFFPLLKEEMFMQEGLRFDFSPDGSITPSGVVFNEMKGAYSNHDSIAAEYSYRKLFPETVYRFDSGGEPESILGLTYQKFIDFHKKYYHPSNCRIFLYGDIETDTQLKFIQDNVLSRFSQKENPAPDIEYQPIWEKPKYDEISCPPSESNEEEGTTLTLNWKCNNNKTAFDILRFEILAEILIGNMGSPLYKAIVESGLGEDLSPVSGLDSDVLEIVFTLGLRGSSTEKIEGFERLIFNELQKLVDDGIPEDVLKGAIHKVKFRNREIKGGYPFGLRLMSRILKGWLHGSKPASTLLFEAPMQELISKLEQNNRYFEELIQSSLIENKHRLLLSIVPNKEYNYEMEKTIAKAISEAKKDAANTERFRIFQETPDKEEDLAKIPTLCIGDVPKNIRKISTEATNINGATLYKHDLFTNGIIYIDFAISIDDIIGDESFLLPFLSRLLCSSALPGKSYDQVAIELTLKTGGIYTFLESGRSADKTREKNDFLFFRLKTLEEDLSDSFQLLTKLITISDITDRKRVKDLLLEMKNDFKASIIPAGHSYCAVKASSLLDSVYKREEEWRGSSQFMYLSNLANKIDDSIESLCNKLTALRKKLLSKERFSFNITCDNKYLSQVESKIGDFLFELNREPLAIKPNPSETDHKEFFNFGALIVPSAVNFTARSMKAALIGSKYHAHQSILAQLLKTNDLWEEVRMKNGAYGVYAYVNGTEGIFTVSTYRDPAPTQNIFATEKALKSAHAGRYKTNDIDKAIITLVSKDLKPLSPAEEGLIGFRHKLYKITEEIRQQKREFILSVDTEDIKSAAGEFLKQLDSSVTVVMGSKEIVVEISKKTGFNVEANSIVLPV